MELEQKVHELTRRMGIGAQFGGKYFCHDVRVVRLPRHGASCPVGIGVSCSADRQVRCSFKLNENCECLAFPWLKLLQHLGWTCHLRIPKNVLNVFAGSWKNNSSWYFPGTIGDKPSEISAWDHQWVVGRGCGAGQWTSLASRNEKTIIVFCSICRSGRKFFNKPIWLFRSTSINQWKTCWSCCHNIRSRRDSVWQVLWWWPEILRTRKLKSV